MIGDDAIERRETKFIEDNEISTNVQIDKALYEHVGHGGVKLRSRMLNRRENNAVTAQAGFVTDCRC